MKATYTCFKRSYYEFIPSLKTRERIWKNIDIQDYQIGSQSKLNNAIFASIVACSFIMQSKIWKHRKWAVIQVRSDDPLAQPLSFPLNNLELLVHKFKPNKRRNGREIYQNLLKEIEDRKKREEQQQQQQQEEDQQQQQQQEDQQQQQPDEEQQQDPREIYSIDYLLNKH